MMVLILAIILLFALYLETQKIRTLKTFIDGATDRTYIVYKILGREFTQYV